MSIRSKVFGSVFGLVVMSLSTSAMANHNSGDSRHKHREYRPAVNTWFSAGYAFGGDELGRFETSAGSIEKIRAGNGGSFSAGLVWALDPWSNLRLSGGFQRNSLSRLNGDTTFDRVRFGATVLRSHRGHEFGAGLTLHTGVSYQCDIETFCAGDVEFDSALGYTLEYAVRIGQPYRGRHRNALNQGLRIGVRYTGIEYTPSFGGEVVDGSSLGGFVGFVF